MILYKKFSLFLHAILLASILLFGIEQVDCTVSLIESCSIIDHLDVADDLSETDIDGDYSVLHYNNFSIITVAFVLVMLFFTIYVPPLRRSIYRPPKA